MAGSYSYAKLDESASDIDLEDVVTETKQETHHLLGSKLVLVLKARVAVVSSMVIVLFLVACYSIWINQPYHQPARQSIHPIHCGSSSEEARARGCRFELHNFAWVPPACYDEELGSEWDSFDDWGFSRSKNDGNDTDEDFVAACRSGDVRQAWVPWWQHMAHCDLILKKYIRSVMYFRPMDNWTSNWEHNEHCANMMTRYDLAHDFYNSLLHLKFPTCDYSWIDKRLVPSEHAPKHTWHPVGGSETDPEHEH